MDVNIHKIYAYDNIRHLTVIGDTFCYCKDNGPMHTSILKAHKGVDNRLIFRALGPDRIPYDIQCGNEVYARITDPDNSQVVVEKLCRLGPARGIIHLELNAGDLEGVGPGRYNIAIIRTQRFVINQPDVYVEKPMFSDMDDNIAMQIDITEQAYKAPRPSRVILADEWIPDREVPLMGRMRPCFYTDRIPGTRVLNHINGVHSFSAHTQNFTGVLEIWGTLEETPDPYLRNNRWFKIPPSSMSTEIEFYCHTGTQAWTFNANFMWLKFRYFPSQDVLDPGQMTKLIVRC